MNIAVVDAGTNLKAFTRMDGAWLGSIDIAINKAFTAKAFDISARELGQNSQCFPCAPVARSTRFAASTA